MRTLIKNFCAAVALLSVMYSASAQVTQSVTMTFRSGASFNGTVTFANDYSHVLDVTGTLTGYQLGLTGYQGSGSDAINWVWANGMNFSAGGATGNYSTFLMDGPGSGYTNTGVYSNWIQLAYNYTSAPVLSFTSGVSVYGTDNRIDYNDPMVSGSFAVAVPEPETYALMLAGLGLLGAVARRRQAKSV